MTYPNWFLTNCKLQLNKTPPVQEALKTGMIAQGQSRLDDLLEETGRELDALLVAYLMNRTKFGNTTNALPLPPEILQPLLVAVKAIGANPLQIRRIDRDATTLRGQLEQWGTHYEGWRNAISQFCGGRWGNFWRKYGFSLLFDTAPDWYFCPLTTQISNHERF